MLIDGENIYAPDKDVTEIRKKTGLLAQRPYMLPMSIYENVAYGLRIHRCEGQGAGRQCSITWRLPVYGTRSKTGCMPLPRSLSIGQQQRLCLARGLAVEPEILLGDEPTSALDPISAAHIEGRLLELKKKYTIVVVTHTLRQAKRLADYVIFMYLGEVVESGPAKEVFENPKMERTRGYLSGQF